MRTRAHFRRHARTRSSTAKRRILLTCYPARGSATLSQSKAPKAVSLRPAHWRKERAALGPVSSGSAPLNLNPTVWTLNFEAEFARSCFEVRHCWSWCVSGLNSYPTYLSSLCCVPPGRSILTGPSLKRMCALRNPAYVRTFAAAGALLNRRWWGS